MATSLYVWLAVRTNSFKETPAFQRLRGKDKHLPSIATTKVAQTSTHYLLEGQTPFFKVTRVSPMSVWKGGLHLSRVFMKAAQTLLPCLLGTPTPSCRATVYHRLLQRQSRVPTTLVMERRQTQPLRRCGWTKATYRRHPRARCGQRVCRGRLLHRSGRQSYRELARPILSQPASSRKASCPVSQSPEHSSQRGQTRNHHPQSASSPTLSESASTA